MSNYVKDNLDLANFPKVDGATGATGKVDDVDMNAIRTALNDIKAFLRTTLITPLINAIGGSSVICGAVYASAAGSFAKAIATSLAAAQCVGLSLDAVANGQPADVQTTGIVTATTAQWDAVTGQVGGLTFNAQYYVDPTTAGKLTATAPTTVGQFVTSVGIALSTTQLRLTIAPPIGL